MSDVTLKELETLKADAKVNLREISGLQKEKSSLENQVANFRKEVMGLHQRIDDLEDKDGNTSIDGEAKPCEHTKTGKDKSSNFKKTKENSEEADSELFELLKSENLKFEKELVELKLQVTGKSKELASAYDTITGLKKELKMQSEKHSSDGSLDAKKSSHHSTS